MTTELNTSNAQSAYQNDRVRQHTSSEINAQIDQKLVDTLQEYLNRSEVDISQRLKELSQEWDTERVLEANASVLAFVGLILGLAVSPYWFWLPGIVLPFLFQHAVQGWCPPLFVIRRLGVRTQREIAQEKYALKVLRGDFSSLNNVSSEDTANRIDKILRAIKQ